VPGTLTGQQYDARLLRFTDNDKYAAGLTTIAGKSVGVALSRDPLPSRAAGGALPGRIAGDYKLRWDDWTGKLSIESFETQSSGEVTFRGSFTPTGGHALVVNGTYTPGNAGLEFNVGFIRTRTKLHFVLRYHAGENGVMSGLVSSEDDDGNTTTGGALAYPIEE
jgi:hypothetical protein